MSTLDTAASPRPIRLDAATFAPPSDLTALRAKALIAGGIGAALSLLGFFVSRPEFFRGYLIAWLLCLSIALGSLALSMVHHLSRGAWGLMARRIWEAAARTLPLLLVLSLPVVLGLPSLYEWARPEVAGDPGLTRHGYLSPTWFVVRLVLYFAIWGLLAWRLDRLSAEQDRRADPDLFRRMQRIAAPGLVIYCLVSTLASVDWLVSIEPRWYSTIYGIYFFGGHGLTAMAFLILMARWLADREPMRSVLNPNTFHDYGKLLFTFVMLWAYFCFSQFLIIWAGNLPEEVSWYDHRTRHGWGPLALVVAICHFFIPFGLLLSRGLKRSPRKLVVVAFWMLAMRWVDFVWQVEPTFHPQGLHLPWVFLATLLGLGGVWLWAFLGQLQKRPLLPVNDPYLAEAVGHE
ncbi:MAG TPA: hypothetical protein VN783_07210 [Thermoanaerobaculia bacterium]|nr:hypothetical protein [Thermoanaerobaculia bacterium]